MKEIGKVISTKGGYTVNFIDGQTREYVHIGFRDNHDYARENYWLMFNEDGYAEIISNPYKPLFNGEASIKFERKLVLGPKDSWMHDSIGKVGKNVTRYGSPTFEFHLIDGGFTWITDYAEEKTIQTDQWVYREYIAYEGCGDAGGSDRLTIVPSPYHIPTPPMIQYKAKESRAYSGPSRLKT